MPTFPSPQQNLVPRAIAVAALMCVLNAQAQETAPAASQTEPAAVMPTVEVQGAAENAGGPVDGYAAKRSGSAMRGDVALRDTPQAVSVISAQALADLAPRTLDEIADYVAGVDREAAQANPYALSFYIRGFNTAGAASSYNGFREYGFETPQSAVNIERIEFVKGPASVLYGGAGALSGLVNIVSKKPQQDKLLQGNATIGSFGHRRVQLDATGPLTADKRVLYRVTAEIDKDGNFVRGAKQQSHFFSPVLTWQLTPATSVEAELVVQRIDRPGREAYFTRHPDFFRAPLDIQLGDPGTKEGGGGTLNRDLGRVELTHMFSNGVKFRQGLFAQYVASDDSTIQATSYNPTTQMVSRRVRDVDSYDRARVSQTEFSGSGKLGGMEHQWLIGLEAGKLDSGYVFNVAPYSPISLVNPVYPGKASGTLSATPWEDSYSEFQALYVQDLMSITPQFKLVVGGRQDRLRSWAQSRSAGALASVTRNSAFSPRVGLVWQPDAMLSAYASFTESFRVNRGTDRLGRTFDPQTGEQLEVGVKFDPSARLTASAALFQYERGNVPTTDPVDNRYSVLVGEQRSRGLELEALGQVARGVDLIASYTYMQAEVTQDRRLAAGDRLVGVPRHAAGLFAKLSLARFALPKWSATAGLSYAGARVSGLPNDPDGNGPLTSASVELPSYTTVNAGVFYDAGNYSVRVTGRNLNNARIYDGYNSTFQPRAPRSVSVDFGFAL